MIPGPVPGGGRTSGRIRRIGPGYYAESPVEDPKGPETGKYKSVRGGGWHAGPYCNRVYRRLGLLPYWVDINVGFRCAGDVSKPTS
jgi:iron(II)-dependent oxidoreductase